MARRLLGQYRQHLSRCSMHPVNRTTSIASYRITLSAVLGTAANLFASVVLKWASHVLLPDIIPRIDKAAGQF